MSPSSKLSFLLFIAIAVCLTVIGCGGGGPAAPLKGTPPFYWQAAKETFVVADYNKTRDHLEQLCKTSNEFTGKAQPWLLVLNGGLATGYMELADSYESGARANRANPTPFRRLVSRYRTNANSLALPFAEAFDKFQAGNKDASIPFAFPVPTGNAAEIGSVVRAAKGMLLPDSEIETAEMAALKRAVLLATCKAAGAKGDVAKTQELFKDPNPQVPRAAFLLYMASELYDFSQIYVPQKLDNPERIKMFCNRAVTALKGVPAGKDSKELDKKIQAALKKVR